MNGESTIAWLQKIEHRYPATAFIDLYLDKARYYRSKQVAQYLQTCRIRLHFLPPYLPNLNPIERLWKLLKRQVINSRFTSAVSEFRERILDFFTYIGHYKDKLTSLINTNFQTLKPADAGLQYPV